ncbi:MAG: hypothetical protein F6K26_42015 [Moorea sp. SIO2I5]|nr:hypothetical protein [Moorena sp. SIO2I5]
MRYGTGSSKTSDKVEHQGKPAPNAPYALFPTPCSRFPTPDSRFPTPSTKKNSVKFWLIPILDRIIFCNSQEP